MISLVSSVPPSSRGNCCFERVLRHLAAILGNRAGDAAVVDGLKAVRCAVNAGDDDAAVCTSCVAGANRHAVILADDRVQIVSGQPALYGCLSLCGIPLAVSRGNNLNQIRVVGQNVLLASPYAADRGKSPDGAGQDSDVALAVQQVGNVLHLNLACGYVIAIGNSRNTVVFPVGASGNNVDYDNACVSCALGSGPTRPSGSTGSNRIASKPSETHCSIWLI